MSAHNLFAADPLLQAMFQKDIDKVQELLASGAELVTAKVPGLSPLQVATRSQQRDLKEREIAALVVAQARLLTVDALTLPLAARIGHLESVRYHTKLAPLSAFNRDDYTMAAVYAVQEGHLHVVRLLLAAGVNPDSRSNGQSDLPMDGQPLLSIAAATGQVQVAKLLVEHKADVDLVYSSPYESNITPLMEAARFNKLPIVKLLVAAGCEVGLKNNLGWYALTYARRDGNKNIVSFLNALPAQRNLSNELTLHEVARDGVLSRIDELIKVTGDLNEVDTRGNTALMLAARFGNWEILEILCAAGADPNFVNCGENSIWQCVLVSDDLKSVQCLLRHGLNPNLRLKDGKPPLVSAAEASRLEIVQELLKAGADPHAVYKPDVPPDLHIAATGRSRIAKERASLYQPYDALTAAKRSGNRKAYQFLKTLLGAAGDAYDEASARTKTLSALADKSFQAETKRLGKILQVEGKPWFKRKDIIHFIAPLNNALSAHYPPPSNVRDLFAKNYATDEIAMFRRLQGEVIERGYTLFYTELDYEGKSLARLLLIPVDDPLVALVACGTNANNYGMGTREIVNWCAETLRKNPFNILGAGSDFIDLDFNLPIIDVAALIDRVTEFCPEITNQNADELAVFGQRLDKSGRCFFWWD